MIPRSTRTTANSATRPSRRHTAVVEEDRQRWDARYAAAAPAVPRSPVALTHRSDLADALPRSGRAADIAAGTGASTIWLAQRGLEVCALEISPLAIGLIERGAEAAGVGHRVETRLVDLDSGIPGDLQDLEVVVCQRFRDVRLYATIVDVLAPGGTGIVTVLSSVGLPGPQGTFHAGPEELVQAFARSDTDVLHHAEAGGVASIVFRRTGS